MLFVWAAWFWRWRVDVGHQNHFLKTQAAPTI
jgi:hypothetical protein